MCDVFWAEVGKHAKREEMPPVIFTTKFYLVSVLRDDMFVVATVTNEVSPLLIIEFLHRVVNVFIEYFGSVDEMSIKENFSTCYQLLEEMMDNGYPLTTEPNALRAMIHPPTAMGKLQSTLTGKSTTVAGDLAEGMISSMPWRKAGVKYAQNEIYIDIIEEVDAILDRNGTTISSEVTGVVQANSRLSGIPDLTLTFVDPNVIDDCGRARAEATKRHVLETWQAPVQGQGCRRRFHARTASPAEARARAEAGHARLRCG